MREQQGCCWAAPGSCGGEQGCGAALHSFQHGLVGKVAWETPFPTGALPLPPSATVTLLLEGWVLISYIFKRGTHP